ncbi:MAG: lipopolysaccharide biosynthesis protein [Thermoleophilia bacterium]|nr:lipopolysaccharide biosynthesis protein [Thermoleophilia bacterium]
MANRDSGGNRGEPGIEPHTGASSALTLSALSGVKWAYTSSAISVIAAVGLTAALARLLGPEAFGLVAMSGVVIRFGSYFAQMGVGSALVQRLRIYDQDILASQTVAVALGAVFSVFFWLAGPSVAWLVYHDRAAGSVVRVVSLMFLLDGLSVTSTSLLRRRLAFRRLAVNELLSYLIGYGALSVALAALGYGVWSVVFGLLSQSAIAAVLNYNAVRHPIGICMDGSRYRTLIGYGGRVSVISFFEFLGYSIGPVAIGRFLGASTLGYFSNAQRLANYSTEKLVTGLTRVLFPSFSSVQDDQSRLRGAFLSSYSIAGLIAVPLSVMVAVSAREVITVLLGQQWLPAVPLLRLMSLAAPFTFLSHMMGVLFDSVARLTAKLLMNVAYLVVGVGLVALALPYGVSGVAAAYCAVEAAYWLACVLLTRQILNSPRGAFARRHRVMLLAGIMVAALGVPMNAGAKALGIPAIAVLLVEVLAGFLPVAGLALVAPTPLLKKEFSGLYSRLYGPGMYEGGSRLMRWYARRNRAWLCPVEEGAE